VCRTATPGEAVVLTLPRSEVTDVLTISSRLLDRMHELLERNTRGGLAAVEREELETLVQMPQFGQILSAAVRAAGNP
jgi:hypothetical protein